MTVMFNADDYKSWSEFLGIIKNSGFKLHDIEPIGYSHNSVVQENRSHGLKHDFLLTSKKTKLN